MTIEKIYWDSDAFLGHLQNEPGKANLCQGTLIRANKEEVLIVTSTLTPAEVLWMRNAPRITADKANIVKRFFRRSYIRLYNVTRSISEYAQELVWSHNVKPKDAIHVATALQLQVDALETFDEGLIALSGKLGNPPLVIRKPQQPKQGELDFDS